MKARFPVMVHVQKPFTLFGIKMTAFYFAVIITLIYYVIMSLLQLKYSFLQPITIPSSIVIFISLLSFVSLRFRGEPHADTLFPLSKRFWLSFNGRLEFKEQEQRHLIAGQHIGNDKFKTAKGKS